MPELLDPQTMAALTGELLEEPDFVEGLISRITGDVQATATGSFVRFENGLQVCWAAAWEGATDSNGHVTYPLPAAFLDTGYAVSLQGHGLGAYILYEYRQFSSASGVRIRALDASGSRYQGLISVALLALGRWK